MRELYPPIEPYNEGYLKVSDLHTLCFQQRGCGKSTPRAELQENTTWDIVADIEKLRDHLGIESWVVFGGSWGSTLALSYSETYPSRCLGLILPAIAF